VAGEVELAGLLEMKKNVARISDHALLRYMERVGKVDVEAIREAMLTDRLKAACEAGARAVHIDDFTYEISKDGTVVTVIPKHNRPGRHHTRARRDEEAKRA
jgi:hypothetical protein